MPSYEYQQVASPWVNTSNRFAVVVGYDANSTSSINVKDPQGLVVDNVFPGVTSATTTNGQWAQPAIPGRFTHQTTGVPNTFIDNTNTVDDAGVSGGTFSVTIPSANWKFAKKMLVPPGYSWNYLATKQAMVILCATLDDAVAIL